MNDSPGFTCQHCKRKFTVERAFMKHECTQMFRSKEIQTKTGQQAYLLYKMWLEKQRRAAPPIQTFITSSYYSSFIKFAEWAQNVGIAELPKYVELMTKNSISPPLWRRDEAYQLYLEYFDLRASPLEHATITVETLIGLSEHLECKVGEVFSKLVVGEVLELIQQRRLSPWLLLCSSSFKAWYQGLHEGERNVLMKSIGIDFWADRLAKRPADVDELKTLARSLEI